MQCSGSARPADEAPGLPGGAGGQVDRQQVGQVAPPHVLTPLLQEQAILYSVDWSPGKQEL